MKLDKNSLIGVDLSLEISLYEHGFVLGKNESYNIANEYYILYKISEDVYDHGYINESDLDNIVKCSDKIESFLDFVGCTDSNEWLGLNIVIKVSDMFSYWGYENIMGGTYIGLSSKDAELIING